MDQSLERVRVRAEHLAFRNLEDTEATAIARWVPQNEYRRRELQSKASLLTETIAPEACAAAREATEL